MSTNGTSILLVEDDPNLSIVIREYLEMEGYKVLHCKDGKEGLDAFTKNKFDLCILDIMMPRMDGFTLAKEIRKVSEFIPIVFLTAKTMDDDRINGFKAGCDDYITKPFSTEELSLRIKAILKRCRIMGSPLNPEQNKEIHIGNYTFDPSNMLLTSEKSERNLTRKESALLKLLSENINQIVTREFALRTIWGDDDYFIGRSMDVFITKLRKYLGEDPAISITNIHGTGFRLEVKE